MPPFNRLLFLAVTVLFYAFSTLPSFASTKTQQTKTGKISLSIDLIWEGYTITKENIDAIKQFKAEFPQVKFIHFISPNYFLRSDLNPQTVEEQINSVISTGDNIGLNLLAWKTLAKEAGVTFRNAPTFWGNVIKKEQCEVDCGYEVPINSYSLESIVRMVATSKDILEDHNFPQPKLFLAGGWMASPQVLEAAALQGFSHDFSSVPLKLLKDDLKNYPIYQWLTDLWESTSPLSQPQTIKIASYSLIEVHNNTASLDYISEKKIIEQFNNMSDQALNTPSNSISMNIGLYQETAFKNIQKLKKVIQHFITKSKEKNITLEFNSFTDSTKTMLVARSVPKENKTKEESFPLHREPERDFESLHYMSH